MEREIARGRGSGVCDFGPNVEQVGGSADAKSRVCGHRRLEHGSEGCVTNNAGLRHREKDSDEPVKAPQRGPERRRIAFGDTCTVFDGSLWARMPRREAASRFQSSQKALGVGTEMERACGIMNEPLSRAVLAPDEDADIRVDKVLALRRQLGEGTYDIEERLDVIIERIIEDLGTV